MRLAAIVLAIFETVLASSEAAAITTYSSSPFRQLIAIATVPARNDIPLYFSIRTGTLGSGKTQGVASADGFYYQSSGAVKINTAGQITTLLAGDGMFIPAGTRLALKANGAGQSSTYLQFLLASAPGSEPAQPIGGSVEVYRSPSPIPDLMPESNLVTLSRVPVPPEAPCDPLHQRSGAALHYILAGVGAEFTVTRATARGPGSVSYEPHGVVYQWSNPGLKPLVYLVFNINPKGVPPVVGPDDYAADPFLANSHVTWAIYCIALSLVLTVLVFATTRVDHDQETDDRPRKR
jgi:mannose-6-phosphate isomerase-like protein (cupin superfamily)